MRALRVTPPAKGAHLGEVPAPELVPGTVRVRTLECGVCGTDRDIASGLYGQAPPGRPDLILGHENLGTVIETAAGVTGFAPGDLVVATVRRGCGKCRFCAANRSDFCETGAFTERGIRGQDGYMADEYVEAPDYLVRVPKALRSIAVILEPLSVVEKAVEQGAAVLARLHPPPSPTPSEPTALIAGTGAIGILAAFRLRLEGFGVTAIDRHGDDTPAGRLLAAIGARHVNAGTGLDVLGEQRFELIVEATGSANLDFALLQRLGPNGALVLTGIPAADRPPFLVAGGGLLRDVVLDNQAIVGSVNANRRYFALGLRHLAQFRRRWGTAIGDIITERHPLEEFATVLNAPTTGAMKSVLVVNPR